jgi:hypothetical protein
MNTQFTKENGEQKEKGDGDKTNLPFVVFMGVVVDDIATSSARSIYFVKRSESKGIHSSLIFLVYT